ncbi:hypothetical protein [Paenibacillus sp. MMS20-IR301]|uniref:hypothetical protein n=1 Tax=Paenibacillus sp. MMS20-IR301 TaxID=2895946 RepID=UPI0028E220F8|nr:hypothetical protein [Paenibacillus sp. MMS20-IR301]WNS45289.1 hypothetical protein LOS79_08475 [Paenibacillus sp. MMS20-IR301]
MLRTDPVYQILKLIGAGKQPDFQLIGMNERDFTVVLQHTHAAGYAGTGGLHPAGLDYIKGYERRLNRK